MFPVLSTGADGALIPEEGGDGSMGGPFLRDHSPLRPRAEDRASGSSGSGPTEDGEEPQLLHTALMLPVCHGFGGKVPSYGEWKAGHQEEGLYYIYMWSLCGEVGRS